MAMAKTIAFCITGSFCIGGHEMDKSQATVAFSCECGGQSAKVFSDNGEIVFKCTNCGHEDRYSEGAHV